MTLLSGLIALVAGCLAGWYGRYFLIEPAQVDVICAAVAPPAWCAARSLLIAVTFRGTWGVGCAASAAACWLLRGRAASIFVVVALFMGGLGLFLYDTGWAASGVLAALVRAPRIGEERPGFPA